MRRCSPVADIDAFLALYVGDGKPDELPATYAPARAASFAGLPPAYIATAGTTRCATTGWHTRSCCAPPGCRWSWHNAETLVHGYVSFGIAVPAAAEAFAASLAALKAGCRPVSGKWSCRTTCHSRAKREDRPGLLEV